MKMEMKLPWELKICEIMMHSQSDRVSCKLKQVASRCTFPFASPTPTTRQIMERKESTRIRILSIIHHTTAEKEKAEKTNGKSKASGAVAEKPPANLTSQRFILRIE